MSQEIKRGSKVIKEIERPISEIPEIDLVYQAIQDFPGIMQTPDGDLNIEEQKNEDIEYLGRIDSFIYDEAYDPQIFIEVFDAFKDKSKRKERRRILKEISKTDDTNKNYFYAYKYLQICDRYGCVDIFEPNTKHLVMARFLNLATLLYDPEREDELKSLLGEAERVIDQSIQSTIEYHGGEKGYSKLVNNPYLSDLVADLNRIRKYYEASQESSFGQGALEEIDKQRVRQLMMHEDAKGNGLIKTLTRMGPRLLVYGVGANVIPYTTMAILATTLNRPDIATAIGAYQGGTLVLPIVPGIEGLFRGVFYGLAEGVYTGYQNYRKSIDNGENSRLWKKILLSCGIGLTTSIDGGWALVPIIQIFREMNVNIHPNTLINLIRVSLLLNRYGIEIPYE